MSAWTRLSKFRCQMAVVSTCGSAGPLAGFRWCFTMGHPELPRRYTHSNALYMPGGFAW